MTFLVVSDTEISTFFSLIKKCFSFLFGALKDFFNLLTEHSLYYIPLMIFTFLSLLAFLVIIIQEFSSIIGNNTLFNKNSSYKSINIQPLFSSKSKKFGLENIGRKLKHKSDDKKKMKEASENLKEDWKKS